MRDLNHDLNGTSWHSYCGESNLPNGQYYYGVLPRPNPDLFPGVDKDFLKQKMLEHEAVFKNQVFELHRLYRVQRDLMDEMKKKEELKNRTVFEASSSSSPTFLFSRSKNLLGPPVSRSEFIESSPCGGSGSHKGKNVQVPSPRNSEVSESRPTKLRRMIDLQLPADAYLDPDEVEQSENSGLRKPNALADLNEIPEIEETTASASVDFLGFQNQDFVTKVRDQSVDVFWRPNHGNINGMQSSSCYNDTGNGQNWFSSMLKAGVNNPANHFEKEQLRRGQAGVFENPNQPLRHSFKEESWPPKTNSGFNVFERSPHLSFNNLGGKLSSFQTQKPVQMPSPLPVSAKCSQQSPIQSNGFVSHWWNRPKPPVQDKCQASKASLDYENGSYKNKASKARNSFDLNSTGDGLSDEGKGDDRVSSVLPWLKATSSNNESTMSSRNCPNRSEVKIVLDHQDSVASTSGNAIPAKKILFDINLPCEDDPEEDCDVVTAANEVEEVEKIESGRSNGVRNMIIDLNSSLTEDETPLTTSLTNCSSRTDRCVIDLEAPINLDDDDDLEHIADEELAQNLVRVAAESIVNISSLVLENRDSVSSDDAGASVSEEALRWFVDIACSCSDDFEEMTLNLTECTVDEYFPNPPKFDFPETEKTEPGPVNVTGRARRGPARRGKQKRDFQRDILPGLGLLARHEVTEDLQTFGGLMRATGHAWQCATRKNGSRRGRKKKVATISPPPVSIDAITATTTAFASESQKTGEIPAVLVDQSLSSWGKTTRRPRRQRCPSTGAGNRVSG